MIGKPYTISFFFFVAGITVGRKLPSLSNMNQTPNSSYSIANPNESKPNAIVVKEEHESVEHNTSEFFAHYGESSNEKSDPLQVETGICKIKEYEEKFLLENNRAVVQGVKVENVDLDEDKIVSGAKEDKNYYTEKLEKDNLSLHCVNQQIIDACDKEIKVELEFPEETDFKECDEGKFNIEIKEEKIEKVENEEHEMQMKFEVKNLENSEIVEGMLFL